MEVRKLLIAEGTEEFRIALADALSGAYHVRTCREGREALELLHSFNPDIVVLDMMLPGMDGISILQRAAEEGIRPLILATTRFVSDYVMDSVDRLGVGYMMVKPCDVSATISRLADLSQRIRQPVPAPPDPRNYVSNVLLTLGIPTKLRGYGYLREAIMIMARSPGQSITKELYPAVAARCGCEPSHVERSSRSAIAAAWQKREEQTWQIYFQPCGDGELCRPTNAEFITRIAETVRLPLKPED